MEAFFNETNRPTESEWLDAVKEVREGNVDAPLPKQPANSPRTVEVTILSGVGSPADNVLIEERPQLAA